MIGTTTINLQAQCPFGGSGACAPTQPGTPGARKAEETEMREAINFFVSYAHGNKDLVGDFLKRLTDVLAPSKRYRYSRWQDSSLLLGEDWRAQIDAAIKHCDMGLLMISPAFLSSKFITENELPAFVSGDKPVVPVMLQAVDFELHDLKGLEKKQIFRFECEGFTEPRAYGECKSQRRNEFVLKLFREIERKLERRTAAKGEVEGEEGVRPFVTLDPLEDLRIYKIAAEAYRRRGTPKHFLDSQVLTQQQKAELYDKVVLSEKGRPAKNNPYK